MPEIVKNRTIRPSTRKHTSPFRIHIKGVAAGDTLIVNINRETKLFRKAFKFRGSDVIKKKSLSFKVNDDGTGIKIKWISTQPING